MFIGAVGKAPAKLAHSRALVFYLGWNAPDSALIVEDTVDRACRTRLTLISKSASYPGSRLRTKLLLLCLDGEQLGVMMHPEHRSIGELAYHLWQSRGCPEGTAEQDWREAEERLRVAQHPEPPTLTDAVDRSLQGTYPASDPPASRGPDAPPANADAKWQAAGAKRKPAVRVRTSKSAQGKPHRDPNNGAAG